VSESDTSESSEEASRKYTLHFLLNIGLQEQEEFYTPGSLELLEARRRIAEFSLPRLGISRHATETGAYMFVLIFPDRAQKRIAQQREEHSMPLSQILDIRKQVFTHIKVRDVHSPIAPYAHNLCR